MNEHVSKPLDADKLIETIANMFQDKNKDKNNNFYRHQSIDMVY